MATPAAPAADNPYGLMQALQEGGLISWATFIILVIMSLGTFYILFTKLFSSRRSSARATRSAPASGTRPTCAKPRPSSRRNSAYRAIVDDALVAQEQHGKLTDPIDQHDWMANSLARSQGAIGARLGEGLAFLATVGSTAPFIGLFGTVIGIYRALIKIGASGQASISDRRRPGRRSADHDRARPGRRGSRGARLQLADPPQQVDHGGSRGLHQRPARLSDVERCGEAAHGRSRRGQAGPDPLVGRADPAGSEPLRPDDPTGAQATDATDPLSRAFPGRRRRRPGRAESTEGKPYHVNERRPSRQATKTSRCRTSTPRRSST